MLKKYIKVICVLVLAGFSFYYTEKVTKLIKYNDPIMIKINDVKDNSYISVIDPIINKDEYILGINGCEVDINKSYDVMKKYGEFNNELLVMKEVRTKENLKDKYIIGANKYYKNIGLIFIVDDKINDELIQYLSAKKIKGNMFMSREVIENNLIEIKFIAENNNIYYLGDKGVYDGQYMLYINNLIKMNTNNESKYCLVEDKNDDILRLCLDYNMKTIKIKYINNDIINNIKDSISNGSIIAINSDDIEKIKYSINYILSKGYNIVSLDELLDDKNTCKKD